MRPIQTKNKLKKKYFLFRNVLLTILQNIEILLFLNYNTRLPKYLQTVKNFQKTLIIEVHVNYSLYFCLTIYSNIYA